MLSYLVAAVNDTFEAESIQIKKRHKNPTSWKRIRQRQRQRQREREKELKKKEINDEKEKFKLELFPNTFWISIYSQIWMRFFFIDLKNVSIIDKYLRKQTIMPSNNDNNE